MNYNIDYVELYEKEKQRKVGKTFSRFMLALFLYTAVSYAVILALQTVLVFTLGEEKTLLLLDNIYVQWLFGVGPMYLVGLPLLVLITVGMKSEKREKKKLSLKDFGALILICQALTLLGSIIGTSVTDAIGAILGRDITSSTTELIENSPLWLIFIIAVIIGPIVEELIFRKLLIDRIGKYGDLAAILTSGIAFGLFHGNFEQFFYATLLGILFAFVYTKTGNWIHTALLHIAVNFLGSIVAIPVSRALNRLMEIGEEITSDVNMLQYTRDSVLVTSYSILQYASVAVGIFIIFSAFRKKRVQIPNNSQVYIRPSVLVGKSILNVGTILFLICSFLQFLASIFLV